VGSVLGQDVWPLEEVIFNSSLVTILNSDINKSFTSSGQSFDVVSVVRCLSGPCGPDSSQLKIGRVCSTQELSSRDQPDHHFMHT
jgi:hypothetical protein